MPRDGFAGTGVPYKDSMSHHPARAPKIVYAGGHGGTADYPAHKHENAWELLYLREGNIAEICQGESIDLTPGMFIVHPPGAVHGDRASSDYFLYHILVTSPEPLAWPRVGWDMEGAPIRALLELIVRDWYGGWIYRDAFLKNSVQLLDILMKRCAAQAKEENVALRVVSRARGIFRRDFREPIHFGELARKLGVSRSTLYAYFDQVLGRTPQEVLDEIRLKHAVFLLRHSELSVDAVAKGSGFCSSSHLGRKLRLGYKLTAREIRDTGKRAIA